MYLVQINIKVKQHKEYSEEERNVSNYKKNQITFNNEEIIIKYLRYLNYLSNNYCENKKNNNTIP